MLVGGGATSIFLEHVPGLDGRSAARGPASCRGPSRAKQEAGFAKTVSLSGSSQLAACTSYELWPVVVDLKATAILLVLKCVRAHAYIPERNTRVQVCT